MATKARTISDPNSCLNTAADDEEIFVLRANDELAPQIVRAWAQEFLYQKTILASPKNVPERQHAKFVEAMYTADRMEVWKSKHSATDALRTFDEPQRETTMPSFLVKLQRTKVHTTTVQVNAEDDEAASELAIGRAEDHEYAGNDWDLQSEDFDVIEADEEEEEEEDEDEEEG